MFSQLAQTLNPFVQNTKWYDINGEGIFKILIYCFQANSTFSRKTGGHSQNFENAAIFIWLVVIPRLRAPWQAAHAQTFFSPVMFRREFCKNFGALFSLTRPSSTLPHKTQATKTCKMSLVTISGMDVQSVMNTRGQIQVIWCPRWRFYRSNLCDLKFTSWSIVFLSWL